ncbi:MAG: riboflavin biosynthesis protein RibF [Verrucomicrobiae bacterium]|nr:riboflavin biosynthesis protein RibF [Verrucomicrobiae bacterium]
MNVLREAGPIGHPARPVSLAIGVFDGVHRGHAEVVRRTLARAESGGGTAVAVTFDRHPQSVLAPDKAPPMLVPLWRRLEAIEALGLATALVYGFDLEFSRQPAERFIERLRTGFGKLLGITVGTGFVFGHRRSGNLELIERLGRELGFAVEGVPPIEEGGEPISSTRVRERVAAGDFAGAGVLLGRPYSLAGEVVPGDRLGTQLGFPTANLDVTGLALPPAGVYAATAWVDGSRRPAAVNIGWRPTVGRTAGTIRVEAHLPGFAGDLYGRRLELELVRRLRGEVRFESRQALVEQIGRDVAEVREWAGNNGLPSATAGSL